MKSEKKKIVALIPARGGSKRIKTKNIVDFCGMPLIAYSIIAAYYSEVEEVWVSTDDEAIERVSKVYGAEVIRRPGELCRDNSPTEEAIEHFLKFVNCDIVVLLQATSPMLTSADINRGIEKFLEGNYQSLFSAAIPEDMLLWGTRKRLESLNYDFRKRGRSQDREKDIIIETGGFYIFSRELFERENCRLGGKIGYIEVPFWTSFEVDTPEDRSNISKLMCGGFV